MTIKAVVIDDETNSRDSLKQMVHIYCPEVMVIGEADGVATGLQCITEKNPDLVFLDIKMADGSGFDLLQKLAYVNFKLIFVTAYEEYAIRAFRYNAVDYINKPIDPDELRRAVEKATTYFNGENMNETIRMLLESMKSKNTPKNRKLVLRTINTVHVVEIDRIMHCESDRNYTVFYLVDGEKILISRSMKEFDELLEGHGFLRVHNSHLLNLNYLSKFMRDELICILKDNTTIPVAYRKRDELLEAIKAMQ